MASRWCDCELVAYSLKAQDRSRCTRLGWHSFGKPNFGHAWISRTPKDISLRYWFNMTWSKIQESQVRQKSEVHFMAILSHHRGLDEVRRKHNISWQTLQEVPNKTQGVWECCWICVSSTSKQNPEEWCINECPAYKTSHPERELVWTNRPWTQVRTGSFREGKPPCMMFTCLQPSHNKHSHWDAKPLPTTVAVRLGSSTSDTTWWSFWP